MLDQEEASSSLGWIEIKGLMRTLILIIALLPGMATAAEQQKKKSPNVVVNPCAQYGDGFVQLPGTTTCVKVSGSVQFDVGVKGAPSR